MDEEEWIKSRRKEQEEEGRKRGRVGGRGRENEESWTRGGRSHEGPKGDKRFERRS